MVPGCQHIYTDSASPWRMSACGDCKLFEFDHCEEPRLDLEARQIRWHQRHAGINEVAEEKHLGDGKWLALHNHLGAER